MLREKHKFDRMDWVFNEVNEEMKFPDHMDTVHIDEKWFYLMHDGSRCRVFPDKRTRTASSGCRLRRAFTTRAACRK